MSYIVLEGLDFSGKTSLSKKLHDIYKSRLIAEPFSDSRYSESINDLVKNNHSDNTYKTHLLIATRIEMLKKLRIYSAVNSSSYLISDRSFISNMVYQSETDKEMKLVMDLNIKILKAYDLNVVPNLVIHLSVPYDEALKRFEERENVNELDKKIMKTESAFNTIQDKYKKAIDLLVTSNPSVKVIEYTPEMSLESLIEKIDNVMFDIDSIQVRKNDQTALA